jgi:hypothetical protein
VDDIAEDAGPLQLLLAGQGLHPGLEKRKRNNCHKNHIIIARNTQAIL